MHRKIKKNIATKSTQNQRVSQGQRQGARARGGVRV